MTDGPLLWFLNRATGLSLLAVLSATVVLGVLSMSGRPAGDGGGRVPRFVTQALHRNLALGGVLLLAVHVVTAVADEFVDIRWWDALVPWGASYEPVWLGLGTLALDLMLVVALTTALRSRLGHRTWRVVHTSGWAAWVAAVVHAVMIGTDLRDPARWASWSVVPLALSVAAVAAALGYRLAARRTTPAPVASPAPAREQVGAP